jgi:hypothetical protein
MRSPIYKLGDLSGIWRKANPPVQGLDLEGSGLPVMRQQRLKGRLRTVFCK